jgi:superfamily I DNA/RNA helicase
MKQGRIPTRLYHAVLIDEAQDFAPSWITVIQQMLRPATNMLFIAADGAQKIYRRSLSWRTLGVDLSGHRSRVLNRSYRNTNEILRVAYELVGNDPGLAEDLQSEGDQMVQPELEPTQMRHGPTPMILQFRSPDQEIGHITNEIKALAAGGYAWDEIAVIHRDVKFLTGSLAPSLKQEGIPFQVVKGSDINLASPDVKLLSLHSSKGLEFSVVFIIGVDRLQPRPSLTAEELSVEVTKERQLLYVGMTRARERLYISHTGSLPLWAASALTVLEQRQN